MARIKLKRQAGIRRREVGGCGVVFCLGHDIKSLRSIGDNESHCRPIAVGAYAEMNLARFRDADKRPDKSRLGERHSLALAVPDDFRASSGTSICVCARAVETIARNNAIQLGKQDLKAVSQCCGSCRERSARNAKARIHFGKRKRTCDFSLRCPGAFCALAID